MKKILSIVLVFALSALLFVSCGKEKASNYTAEIVIKDYGTITLFLDGETAPITVNNFVKLANDGFYDGLTFHRIINGFMMQGGAAKPGMQKPDQIKGEFIANGVKNDIIHKRGVISMARMGANPYYGITEEMAMNSADSQFFIMHKGAPHLDGQYAAFGWVTEGIEIVDKICEGVPAEYGSGAVAPENQPVIETIRATPVK